MDIFFANKITISHLYFSSLIAVYHFATRHTVNIMADDSSGLKICYLLNYFKTSFTEKNANFLALIPVT